MMLRVCMSIITLEIVNNFWTYACYNDLFDTLSTQCDILRCFIMLPFCPNCFLHSGHWNSLFPSWTFFTCLFKSNLWLNDLAQLVHWNSFLPSWTWVMCRLTSRFELNNLEHSVHWNSLKHSWTVLRCFVKSRL